ncbi:MAG: TlpA family protein disulfide reductase [Clostridia bacterium]|nr:TlpA family protein disulfide reductase [Clostridia bacterium]
MKKTVSIILLILALLLLIGGAAFAYKYLTKDDNKDDKIIITENTDAETVENSEYIPLGNYTDFTVYTETGENVSLSDKAALGKPVIINFWATWCGYCKMEMPDFEECYIEYGDSIEFMMIDICGGGQDDRGKAQDYIKTEGFTFPVFYDDDLSALSAYYTTGFPTTIVIDSNGNVVYNRSGALTKEQLLSIIDQVT